MWREILIFLLNGVVHLLRQHGSVRADSRVCLEEEKPLRLLGEKIPLMLIIATALGNIMR